MSISTHCPALFVALSLITLACSDQREGDSDADGGASQGSTAPMTDTDPSSTASSETDAHDDADAGEDTQTTQGELDCGSEGTFDTRFTVLEDECGHAPFIGYGDVMSVRIEAADRAGALTLQILGDPGLEAVSGALGDGCSVDASGVGTVAAYPDTQVDWDVVLQTDGIDGILTLGADGALPGNCPIVYTVAPE